MHERGAAGTNWKRNYNTAAAAAAEHNAVRWIAMHT